MDSSLQAVASSARNLLRTQYACGLKKNQLKSARADKEAPAAASPSKMRMRLFANMDPEKRNRLRRAAGAFLLLFSGFLLVSVISHILYAGSTDQSALGSGTTDGVNNQGGWFGAFFSRILVTQGFGYISILLPPYFGLLGFAMLENNHWKLVRRLLGPVAGIVYFVSITLAFFTLVFDSPRQDLGGGVGLLLAEVLSRYIGLVGLGMLLLFVVVAVGIFFFNQKWAFLAFARPLVSRFKHWIGDDSLPETPAAAPAQAANPVITEEGPWADPFATLPDAPVDGTEEIEEEGEFIVSIRKLEPNPGTTAPEQAKPAYETQRKPKPAFLKPAHLVQDELELKLDPETLERLRLPSEATTEASETAEGVAFTIEAPQPTTLAELDAMALSIPTQGDNIHEVDGERFEKIIPDTDMPVLDADEILADGLYDPKKDLSSYKYPPLELLHLRENPNGIEVNRDELEANKNRILKTLSNYGIDITSIKATIGPTVTLYEIVPAPGVRISKIKNLEDDIALSLAALGIRIIAPMPGKGTIGIEIPNSKPEIVSFRSLLATEKFRDSKAELPIAIGKTISNEVYVADLTKMPHLLVAGATGQGKSVGLNCIIASLLYKKHPSQIKFVLIDPKKVEMTLYQTLEKHFLAKLPNYEDCIITDNKQVIHVLNSLCMEMDNRYALLQDARVRNISEYNDKFLNRKLNPRNGHQYLPYIVLIIDELADLMMTAGKEIETPIARLAQLARAVGIHLVVATQRPSVNVITGTIKANFPARMSYRVISKVDSRTILDTNGADQLIGRGDVLYFTGSELIRLQNAFIDTDEVDNLVKFISDQRGYPHAYYLPEYAGADDEDGPVGDFDPAERDKMFEECARLVVTMQQGSTSLLQRRLKLGYNRAGRIMDQLERAGIVGPGSGSKPREVLVHTEAELQAYLNSMV